jgi:hypothetical protein
MKRILLAVTAVVGMSAGLMAASDFIQLNWVGPRGGVMGGVVKNAPYSGEEVATTDNVLGDGTHIHNESRTKVYRDSEGRTRRESADQISIYDPVAGVAYVLNPKTMTAHKVTVSTVRTVTTPVGTAPPGTVTTTTVGTVMHSEVPGSVGAAGGGTVTVGTGNVIYQTEHVDVTAPGTRSYAFTTSTDQISTADATSAARLEKQVAEKVAAAQAMDTLKAETEARMEVLRLADGIPGMTIGAVGLMKSDARAVAKKESLGTQMMEGVVAEGMRTTATLEMGAIGNDRPINTVSERWVSSDLQTVVMTKHSDPRTGEETFRLTNVVRSNPDPSLFELPSGYTLAPHESTAPARKVVK